jgi:hypothetical protein
MSAWVGLCNKPIDIDRHPRSRPLSHPTQRDRQFQHCKTIWRGGEELRNGDGFCTFSSSRLFRSMVKRLVIPYTLLFLSLSLIGRVWCNIDLKVCGEKVGQSCCCHLLLSIKTFKSMLNNCFELLIGRIVGRPASPSFKPYVQ